MSSYKRMAYTLFATLEPLLEFNLGHDFLTFFLRMTLSSNKSSTKFRNPAKSNTFNWTCFRQVPLIRSHGLQFPWN